MVVTVEHTRVTTWPVPNHRLPELIWCTTGIVASISLTLDHHEKIESRKLKSRPEKCPPVACRPLRLVHPCSDNASYTLHQSRTCLNHWNWLQLQQFLTTVVFIWNRYVNLYKRCVWAIEIKLTKIKRLSSSIKSSILLKLTNASFIFISDK